MGKHLQADLFKETKPFPGDLFQAGKFGAIDYFKKWYYIFLYHMQQLEDDKALTDEIGRRVAQEILENDSIDKIDNPELKLDKQVEIEISHIIIEYFLVKQIRWFQKQGFKQQDIEKFLSDRRQRIDQVELDDLSKELRPKIETSIAYFELIDEEINRQLNLK